MLGTTTLQRLESATSDPCAGGVLVTFPSGTAKQLAWRYRGEFDTLATAKDLAARALQSCLDERRIDDAERTNWASVAAAMARILTDWRQARDASAGGSLH